MSLTRYIALLTFTLFVFAGAACDRDSSKNPPAPPAAPKVTPAPGTSGSTTPTPGATANAADAQAQTLIQQVTDYIKNNKLDSADQALKQLEAMKSKLSPDMQKQVDNLRTMLDAAKAKAIPGVG